MRNYNDDIEWVYDGIGDLLAKLYEIYGKEAGVMLRDKLATDKSFSPDSPVKKTWSTGPLKQKSITPYTIFQFINQKSYEQIWDNRASQRVVDNINALFRAFRSLLGNKIFDELDLPKTSFTKLVFPPTYEFIRGYGLLFNREVSDTMWEHFHRMKTSDTPTKAFTEEMFDFISRGRAYRCDLYRYSLFLHYVVDGYFFRLSKNARTSMSVVNDNFAWYRPTYLMYSKIIAA